eukprot:CAMPEP_0198705718 /NCGR_PEP_ID=MMETSP1468-20131203/390571_1 /TAXON_ID=1461545 /ORGANISM="Mantoniella sp, Strain CCMP1436" /LENGTH=276 /DNA_ID=CAMNT_0044464591 /DNA_START=125 /DNA_END=955 /DNA_ORIENTATION=-
MAEVPISNSPSPFPPKPAASPSPPAEGASMSAKAAGMIRPYMERALPAVVSLGNLVDVAEPYFCAALAYLQYVLALLQPYHPEEFMPAIAGFVLVFFGGNFFTLCAAVEAYRLVGFDDTKKALEHLASSYKVACAASAKDDTVDADGDGVADVKQIDNKQLVLRKAAVVAKAVDPELMGEALTAIYAGLMAVVATLRVKFAACVTIGVTVGGIAHNVASSHLEPVLHELTPLEYRTLRVKFAACVTIGVTVGGIAHNVASSHLGETHKLETPMLKP